MIFEYNGKEFSGTKDEIIAEIRDYFTLELEDGYFCLGKERKEVEDGMNYNLDAVRSYLVNQISFKMPKYTATIDGDDIIISKNGCDTIRVSLDMVYDEFQI